jgi:hypothetical protein
MWIGTLGVVRGEKALTWGITAVGSGRASAGRARPAASLVALWRPG